MATITTYPSPLDLGLKQFTADTLTNFSFMSTSGATSDIVVGLTLNQRDANVSVYKDGKSFASLLLKDVQSNVQMPVTLLVETNGSPVVTGTVDFYYFNNGTVTSHENHPFILRRARVFNFLPDWEDGIVETYNFKTDIFTARSGVEHRTAIYHNPRVTKEFTVATFNRDDTAQLIGCISAGLEYPFIAPDHVRIAYQVNAYPAGSAFPFFPNRSMPTVNQNPTYYFDEGMNLYHANDALSKNGVSIGDRAYVGEVCHMDEDPTVKYTSESSATVGVTLTMHHLSALLDAEGSIDINNVDVSTAEPMLQMMALAPSSESYGLSFATERSQVDGNRNIIERFRNRKFTQKTYAHSFANIGCESANHLIRFFCSHKGRFKPFMISTWRDDVAIVKQPVAGDTTLTLKGEAFYWNYREDPAYRVLALHMLDGSIKTVQFTACAVNNGNTVITLFKPITNAVQLSDINFVSLAPFVRFASDELSVKWHSDRVASIDIKFTTIPIPTNSVL